jgi:hypothetical protein
MLQAGRSPISFPIRSLIELESHGTNSHKASVIGTAVKASQKTVFFDHYEKVVYRHQTSKKFVMMSYGQFGGYK